MHNKMTKKIKYNAPCNRTFEFRTHYYVQQNRRAMIVPCNKSSMDQVRVQVQQKWTRIQVRTQVFEYYKSGTTLIRLIN